MDVNKYTANLFLTLEECRLAIKLIERTQNDELSLNILEKEWTLVFLTDALVIRLARLFDNTNGVVSFKKLPTALKAEVSEEAIARYNEKLFAIEFRSKIFLNQVKNNRDKRIAHTQKTEMLGWTEQAYNAFIASGGYINPKNIRPVDKESEFLVAKNLPFDDIKILINELSDLIFYELLHPSMQKDSISRENLKD